MSVNRASEQPRNCRPPLNLNSPCPIGLRKGGVQPVALYLLQVVPAFLFYFIDSLHGGVQVNKARPGCYNTTAPSGMRCTSH